MTVNVEDFGAVGDGITDDTPAFRAAITAAQAAGTQVVEVPPGEYRISHLDGHRVTLRGESRPWPTLHIDKEDE